VPVSFLISQAYDFEAYQFRPNDPCRRERFDFTAEVPEGITKEQFHRMLQNLPKDRFKLQLHHEKKEMPVYQLTIAENGLKMKECWRWLDASKRSVGSSRIHDRQGWLSALSAGRGGLGEANGHYR
jgi:uncharacterized protein (TIGR03435 family)